MSLRARTLVALGCTSLLLAASRPAAAAGLYFADRGVRPLARAGAFVAGADDLGAMVYNPAGLYDAGGQFLLDAGVMFFSSEYTRRAIVYQQDPTTGKDLNRFEQKFAPVEGSGAPIPIPTLGVSFQPRKWVVLALGAWAPYAALTTYPETITTNGRTQGAPQRYSLISLDGSALAIVGGWAAFAPSKKWRIGLGLEVMTGTFQSSVNFGACVPDKFFCAPEQREWDVLSQIKVGPIVAPSGNGGVTFIPSPKLRVGASVQLPFYVRAGGKIATRMPSTPVFDKASQVGDQVDVAFDLPWQLRAGVEVRPTDDLRLELGVGYDGWHMHDAITVHPKGVALQDVAGFPKSYIVPDVSVRRNFQDSWSIRLGGEYGLDALKERWHLRGGLSYESSAVPADSLTVLTIDGPKVTLGLGAGVQIGKLRVDLTYAHVFLVPTDVDPATAQIQQQNPVLANPPKHPDIINGGRYAASANIVGLGLAYTFGAPPAEFVSAAAEPPAAPSPKSEEPKPESQALGEPPPKPVEAVTAETPPSAEPVTSDPPKGKKKKKKKKAVPSEPEN